jgi:hypothetical protein
MNSTRAGLAVAICMLVSCASTAPASLAMLAGTTWTLVSLGSKPLAQGARPPTAVFDGTRLSGFGGCNRYTGQVEDRYFAALAQVTQYRVAGSRLVLSGSPAELAFERATP